MALVFSSLTNVAVKVDIVFVPAIGADPRLTWARRQGTYGHDRLDYRIHGKLHPSAQTHLYDHLQVSERRLDTKPVEDRNGHTQSIRELAEAEKHVAEYGIAEWGDRLLKVIKQHRDAQSTEKRPILFICHSTGGNVVKEVLSRKIDGDKSDLAGICLAVVFFSTPHHGSKVLSKPEYVKAVKSNLGLKWEMSKHLRNELILRNNELESLNYRFSKAMFGAKILSHVESVDTNLTVLSSKDSEGEAITLVRYCLVDSKSGRLSTAEIPFEDEQFVQLNTDHTGTPKFSDEEGLYYLFLDELHALVSDYSDGQRTAFQALNQTIMSSVLVDVHQFYGDSESMKILTARPTLEEFLEHGPTRCMDERIRGSDLDKRPLYQPQNGGIEDRRSSSATSAPALKITAVDMDELAEVRPNDPATLSAPKLVPPKNIHTRRPSMTLETGSKPSDFLAPVGKAQKQVHFTDNDSASIPRPMQRTPTFKLPSRSTDRFKWIHVPFNHSGWVPNVLTAISQDKDDLSLHSKLLLDKMWALQHNRSRHASPHARFVKPSVKCLFPRGSERGVEALTTTPSAGNDIQFVLYLPYMHWDNFTSMQNRASIISRRREQADPRPVAHEVASGKSLEHKVIWQYLTSDRPVHCRRTLDQYGYPSLRNTTVRDGDQVLYKRTRLSPDDIARDMTKSKLQGARSSLPRPSIYPMNDDVAKVLMVDQLWLWIIDHQTVITFFTGKEREEYDHGISRECDIRSAIYQDINGDYASQCADPFDFAALAVGHSVKGLLEGASDRNLQIFRIFEEYISILTERQNNSFKEFRNNQHSKKTKNSQHVDNRKDLGNLLELRDIEDELLIIEKLIKEQQSCVKDMLTQFHDLNRLHDKGRNGTTFLLEVVAFLSDHESQVEEMLKSARMAQQAFKELLDMKQKHANVVEAQWAREQAEVATDQSRSVMIFTIFTIIFLPLSFFASVFGINAKEWAGEDSNYLPLHQIFTYMGAISLAVIVIALLVAFSRNSRRAAQKVWQKLAAPVFDFWRRQLGMNNPSASDESDDGSGVAGEGRGGVRGLSIFGEYDLEKAHSISANRGLQRSSSMLSRSFSRSSFGGEAPWPSNLRNGSLFPP